MNQSSLETAGEANVVGNVGGASRYLRFFGTGVKVAGAAGMGMMAYEDTNTLSKEIAISNKTGNYDNTVRASARVAGHWTGTIVGAEAGAGLAGAAFAWTGPFDVIPIAVGGLVGGFVGYIGGDNAGANVGNMLTK